MANVKELKLAQCGYLDGVICPGVRSFAWACGKSNSSTAVISANTAISFSAEQSMFIVPMKFCKGPFVITSNKTRCVL